jgi:hypothetical protein
MIRGPTPKASSAKRAPARAVEKHDDKEEQNHDGPGIHDDMYKGDKLRVEEDVEDPLSEEREDQAEGTVDRMAL